MDTNKLRKLGISAGTSPLDDVVEFANTGSFPVSGQAGKIYVSLQDNKIYRRSGVSYAELSSADKVTNNGGVAKIKRVTSMPATPDADTLYIVIP